jgi:serine kinase of HPr protein (carbohydrate metabolism regulator)
LLGSCMGAVFHQRKMLVLHATSIKYGDTCAIFAGDSGIGKSTLAAALHQRGYQVLGDDLCVINSNCEVYPGYPQLKLWHDTTERLDIDTQGLRLIRSQVSKYAYPLGTGFFTTPLPIGTVYLLYRWNKPDFDLAAIHGLEKFRALRNNTYRLEYLEGTDLQQVHMKNCSSLANTVRMIALTRPDDGFQINRLLDLVDEDMKSNR